MKNIREECERMIAGDKKSRRNERITVEMREYLEKLEGIYLECRESMVYDVIRETEYGKKSRMVYP